MSTQQDDPMKVIGPGKQTYRKTNNHGQSGKNDVRSSDSGSEGNFLHKHGRVMTTRSGSLHSIQLGRYPSKLSQIHPSSHDNTDTSDDARELEAGLHLQAIHSLPPSSRRTPSRPLSTPTTNVDKMPSTTARSRPPPRPFPFESSSPSNEMESKTGRDSGRQEPRTLNSDQWLLPPCARAGKHAETVDNETTTEAELGKRKTRPHLESAYAQPSRKVRKTTHDAVGKESSGRSPTDGNSHCEDDTYLDNTSGDDDPSIKERRREKRHARTIRIMSWTKCMSRKGTPFYFSFLTGETVWEKPKEYTEYRLAMEHERCSYSELSKAVKLCHDLGIKLEIYGTETDDEQGNPIATKGTEDMLVGTERSVSLPLCPPDEVYDVNVEGAPPSKATCIFYQVCIYLYIYIYICLYIYIYVSTSSGIWFVTDYTIF